MTTFEDQREERFKLAEDFQERWETDANDPCEDLHERLQKLNDDLHHVRRDEGVIATWLRRLNGR